MRLYQIVFENEELPIFLGGNFREVLGGSINFLWALGKIESPQDTSSLSEKLKFRVFREENFEFVEESKVESELAGIV